MLEKVLFFD